MQVAVCCGVALNRFSKAVLRFRFLHRDSGKMAKLLRATLTRQSLTGERAGQQLNKGTRKE